MLLLSYLRRTFMGRKRYMRPDDYQKALHAGVRNLLLLFVAHIAAMFFLETNANGLWQNMEDAFWVTWATVTTVGYGDMSSATTAGRIATVVLGTLGIITFAGIAGNFINFFAYKRELQNHHRWEWRDMTNHILVVGLPLEGTARYIENLVKELRGRPQFHGHEIQIMATNLPPREEMPDVVKNDEGSVVFFNGSGSEEENLAKANIDKASYVLVLCADPNEADADDVTAAVVYRITDTFGVTVPVVAEVARDKNAAFIKKNGATSVVRATNDYPGLAVTELAAPGAYHIVRDAFTADGNELNDYAVTVNGRSWADVACTLMAAGYDFRGFADESGKAYRFGEAQDVNAVRLFISVPQGQQPTAADIANILAA